jgi:hypothetical protein
LPAFANEQAETELILEQLELLAYGRLRRIELGCGGCEIQVVLGDRGQKSKLLELHGSEWNLGFGGLRSRDYRACPLRIRGMR